jgi:hypothetical protein
MSWRPGRISTPKSPQKRSVAGMVGKKSIDAVKGIDAPL